MKRQHFAALAVLVVLLLAARAFLHVRGSGSAVDPADAGLHRVLAATIDPASVTSLQITPPPPKEGDAPAPLRFERRDGAWMAASQGGAPADGKAVDEFVAKALALTGETRGSGEASWATFGVGPADAVRVELGTNGAAPAATIWIGKQGDNPDAHFARVEGADPIVHVSEGLRGALGLWGASGAPAADLWLSKDVIAVKAADATRVIVERPDMRVVLQKQDAPASDAAPAPAPAAAAWTIAEPALAWTAKAGLDGIVDRMGSVRVATTLDAEIAACQAEPVATITFTLASGADKVIRVRGPVEGKDEAALTIDGQPHCWSLSTWSLATLLPKASALWETPASLVTADPTKVRLERDGKSGSAVKTGEEWKATGAGLDVTKAAALASALRSLRVEDIAREAQAVTTLAATLSASVGPKSFAVRVLGLRPGGSGERYARADGIALPSGYVLVLSKSTAQSLLP